MGETHPQPDDGAVESARNSKVAVIVIIIVAVIAIVIVAVIVTVIVAVIVAVIVIVIVAKGDEPATRRRRRIVRSRAARNGQRRTQPARR